MTSKRTTGRQAAQLRVPGLREELDPARAAKRIAVTVERELVLLGGRGRAVIPVESFNPAVYVEGVLLELARLLCSFESQVAGRLDFVALSEEFAHPAQWTSEFWRDAIRDAIRGATAERAKIVQERRTSAHPGKQPEPKPVKRPQDGPRQLKKALLSGGDLARPRFI